MSISIGFLDGLYFIPSFLTQMFEFIEIPGGDKFLTTYREEIEKETKEDIDLSLDAKEVAEEVIQEFEKSELKEYLPKVENFNLLTIEGLTNDQIIGILYSCKACLKAIEKTQEPIAITMLNFIYRIVGSLKKELENNGV